MSEITLPEGWIFAAIGDLCDLINGRAFKQTEWREKGLPIIRIQNLNKANAMFNYFDGDLEEKHIVNYGDLLFAWSGTPGTSFGAHEWRGEKGALNQHIFKLVFDSKHIDKSFFLHSINFKLNELIGNANGGVGLRHVTKGVFESTLLEYPPLAEQQQIAQKLDELLAQVNTLKTRLDAIPNILKRFRQSVLAAAVSGRLTEEWRGSSDYDFIDDTFSIPNVWAKKSISDICEYITSGSRGWAEYYSDSGSLFVRSQDINTDELVINDAAFVRLPDGAEGKRTKIKKEDLLITITGANVTKCARVKIHLDDAYVSQHVALIRLSDARFSAFVEKALKAQNAGRKQLLGYAYGGGKPGLNLQNIKDVIIGIPPEEEQTEIVRRVEQLFAYADQIEQRVKDAQARVNHLTQSILAKAFRGELTADWRAQNPELISGENSAAALLERIRVEREVAVKQKRKGK